MPGRRAGRHRRPAERAVGEDDVDLDRRIAAGVEDLAPVDALDLGVRHAPVAVTAPALVATFLPDLPPALRGALPAGSRSGRSWSTATPGSSRPSRNSSEAPPPVEMCVNRSARPCCWIAATESPPPTTTVAPASARVGEEARDRPRAVGERGDLEDAEGSVPEDGLRVRERLLHEVQRRAADVDDVPRRRDLLGRDRLVLGAARDLLGDDHVDREDDLHLGLLGRGERRGAPPRPCRARRGSCRRSCPGRAGTCWPCRRRG